MNEKTIPCSKCSAPSRHSILIRLGVNPSPLDPKAGDKDKSRLKVYSFCALHWEQVKLCFPGL